MDAIYKVSAMSHLTCFMRKIRVSAKSKGINGAQMRSREDKKIGGLMILWGDQVRVEMEKMENIHQNTLGANCKFKDKVVMILLV